MYLTHDRQKSLVVAVLPIITEVSLAPSASCDEKLPMLDAAFNDISLHFLDKSDDAVVVSSVFKLKAQEWKEDEETME